MKRHHRSAAILKSLPAVLLALLLCACGAQPANTAPPATLPIIGIQDLDPKASVPNTTAAQPDTETDTAEAVPSGEGSTAAPENTEASEPPATVLPETASETAEPTTAAPPETTAETTRAAAEGLRVWMGDSRFVGIHDTVDYDKAKDYFISGWGQGYNWMVYTAFPQFDALVAKQTVSIVYWSLGANDITNEPSDYNYQLADKYIVEITKLMEKYPDITFYLLSYGPVGPEGMNPNNIPDCDAYNIALRYFTSYIRSHTEMIYIDQGEYIEKTGFKVYDGCHYDAETNKRAYEYVLEQSGQ